MMITGITIALIAVALLFRITNDLRKTIVNCKEKLKEDLSEELPENFEDKPNDCSNFEAKMNLYDRIDGNEN